MYASVHYDLGVYIARNLVNIVCWMYCLILFLNITCRFIRATLRICEDCVIINVLNYNVCVVV